MLSHIIAHKDIHKRDLRQNYGRKSRKKRKEIGSQVWLHNYKVNLHPVGYSIIETRIAEYFF